MMYYRSYYNYLTILTKRKSQKLLNGMIFRMSMLVQLILNSFYTAQLCQSVCTITSMSGREEITNGLYINTLAKGER